MTPAGTTLLGTGPHLLAPLLRASLEGALVIALVALLVRAVPSLPARARCALWWAACLKLVLGLAWPAPVELPLLPSAAAALPGFGATAPREVGSPANAAQADGLLVAAGDGVGPGEGMRSTRPAATWEPAEPSGEGRPAIPAERLRSPSTPLGLVAATLGLVWLLGVAVAVARTVRQYRRLARVIRTARPPAPAAAAAQIEERLRRLAHRFAIAPPRVLVSARVESPQVVGIRRPRLLLPASAAFAATTVEEGDRGDRGAALDMALAHELAHLRRRDLLLGWVPALARGLFFFHPLAALAAREYSLAREAACDAEVLHRLDAAPRDYGRMLLTWGAVRHGGLPAAALGDHRQLKRRLIMLESTSKHAPSRRPWIALAALLPVVLLLLPVRLVAAPDLATAAGYGDPPGSEASAPTAARPPSPRADDGRRQDARPASAPTAPAPVAAPAAAPMVPAVASSSPRGLAAPAAAPAPPATSGVPGVPPPPAVAPAAGSGSHSYFWSSDDSGEPMIYLEGDRSFGFHTSSRQGARVRELRRGDEPLLWFVRDGKEYVIRDPALLSRLKETWRTVTELGEQQGELGGRQGELGGQQGELGAEQGRLGAEQARLGGEQARHGAEIAALAAEQVALELGERDRAAEADLERRRDELEAKIEALGDEMRALGDQQRALGERQRKLGEQQRVLGDQQAELGRRQAEASRRAQAEIDALVDEALRSGKAQRVDG